MTTAAGAGGPQETGASAMVGRFGTWPALVVVAMAALVLSLGLPWSQASGVSVGPSVPMGGGCVAMNDGTLDCMPLAWVPGPAGIETYVHPGYVSDARVGLILAIVAIVVAQWRREPILLLGVPAGVVLALLGAGVTGFSGQIVAIAACVAVLMRLRHVGLGGGRWSVVGRFGRVIGYR